MGRLIDGVLDRIFVILGVLVLSQAPQFLTQYEHRIDGHLAELQLQIRQIEIAASHTGKTLEQYITKFNEAQDADFSMQGELMTQMTHRVKKLSDANIALQNASIVTRPFIFFFHANPLIAKETLSGFQPGFVFNIEGIIYSLAGMFFGLFLYWALRKTCIVTYRFCVRQLRWT